MNQWMINAFVTEDNEGLIDAAVLHNLARHGKEGIHVSYCNNADNDILQLLASIGIAKAQRSSLPEHRAVYVMSNCSEKRYKMLKNE